MTEAAGELEAVEFRVEEEHPRPGTAVFSVRGEADLHVAPDLRDRLGEAIDDGARELVLDFTETTFVDSMLLGVLLGAQKRLREDGGQVQIVVDGPQVRRIFEITLLDEVFPLHASLPEALSASSRGGAA